MTRRTRLAMGIAGLVGVAALFCVYIHARTTDKRLRFNYSNQPLGAQAYAALAAKPGWAAIAVPVAPKVQLRGLLRRPHRRPGTWVLFLPGNDPALLRTGQSFLESLRGDNDWGLAVYAYRGYDSSPGSPSRDVLVSDAIVLFANLCDSEGVKPALVHIVSFSIGGHLAAAVVSAATKQQRQPASLTLLAAVDDIVMVANSRLSRFDLGDRYDTMPLLKELRAPILVVQGDADTAFRGPGPGRAIAKALGTRASYSEIAGADHVDLMTNPDVVARVRAFVTEHGETPTTH